MQAGKLRHHFTLEAPAEGTGDIAADYTPVAKVWGSLTGLGGIESPAIQASADYQIGLRYRGPVTPRHRLVLGTRVFNITSVVDPDGRQRELQVLALEKV